MELGLVELIEQLKRELEQLQQSPSPLFSIAGVDVELKFGVEKTIGAGGKAQWVLFAVDARGEYKDQQVNTIKLTLKPLGSESAVRKAIYAGEIVCEVPHANDPTIA